MKRVLLLLLAMFAFSLNSVYAQAADEVAEETKDWELGGMGSLTFNEVGLFNWSAGGQSNMTLIGNLNLFANRTWETSKWENTLDLGYGFIKNDFIFNPDTRITKAEDKIDFNSKYGKQAWSEKVFYSALFNFRSQFDFGRANPADDAYISRFLAPGYMIFALGLDFKPNDDLSIFISPASGKFTIVSDDSLATTGAFGVNQLKEDGTFRPGSAAKSRMEIGATFRMKYKKDIMENVGYETQLELFSNYIDRPGNIDIRWNNALVAKVNKYITVNFFTDLIYDHDVNINLVDSDGLPILSVNPNPLVDPATGQANNTLWPGPDFEPTTNPGDLITVQRKGPRIQFKEIFGLGLAYKF